MKLKRLLITLSLVVLGCGVADKAPITQDTTQTPQTTARARVEGAPFAILLVDNGNFQSVKIYSFANGVPRRIGRADGLSAREKINIDLSMLSSDNSLMILLDEFASSVGTPLTPVTEDISVERGDVITLKILSQLNGSYLIK